MLRRENDDIQQLSAQVKDLSKEVESIKLQLKVFMAKSVIADMPVDNSENGLAKSVGKVAGDAIWGNDIKQYSQNKYMINQLAKMFSNMFTNQNTTSSFSPTTYQNNYQQAQNFKNISHKL